MNTELRAAAPPAPRHRAFAALANPDFRIYFLATSAVMMADNIEHVISYWVIFQRFHSSFLGGFAVISHWVPFLVLAGYTGALADRFDIRRLIQLGMLLFMGVSIAWGLLIVTDTLTLEKAMLLLVVHGLAGVTWIPASQVLINQIASPEQLPSAVRMSAIGRYLGFVAGPGIGAGLLLLCGPVVGIFLNAAIYSPLIFWLIRAPYGAAFRLPTAPRQSLGGFRGLLATMRVVAANPILLSMTALAGSASFFVGNAYQAQMPAFAHDLGHGRADLSYSILLAADAAGGLVGGLLLESRGLLPPRPRSALMLALSWSLAVCGFALSTSYPLCILLLFVAGFVELAFNAMAQTLVQLNAPAEIRGRVIGVFSQAAMGLRMFSGLSVGVLGASIGIHLSLAASAAALVVLYGAVIVWHLVRGGDGP